MDAKKSNELWLTLIVDAIREGEDKERVYARHKAGMLLEVLLTGPETALNSMHEELFEMLWSEAERKERVAQRAATEQVVAHDEGVMETQPGPATLRPSTLSSNDEGDV